MGRPKYSDDKRSERRKETHKRFRDENKEKRQETTRKWTKANPEKVRDRHLRSKFNITLEDYKVMLENQNGGCDLCGTTVPGPRDNKNFHVDHNHATGKVRALLCDLCNRGLGMFKDNPELLAKAAEYLRKHES